MLSGGQEFVLAIIAIGAFGGVIKTAIRAKHGMPEFPGGGRRARRGQMIDASDENPRLIESLKHENKRLTDQVETMQDRLIVLEKIVTDRGYTLASEIEALRDRPGRIEQGSDA